MAERTEPRIVSFDSDTLILVDHADRIVGYASKTACHEGRGLLHRAFSLFVFDARRQLLLQQRSAAKRLWPLYWSNSCCSHPRRGEGMERAIARRLEEELGLRCPLRYLYKFRYQAPFGAAGSEHELCSVYAGTADARVRPNPHEVAAWRWVAPDALDREIAAQPERFTPWLRLEWQRLRADFGGLFAGRPALAAGLAHGPAGE